MAERSSPENRMGELHLIAFKPLLKDVPKILSMGAGHAQLAAQG